MTVKNVYSDITEKWATFLISKKKEKPNPFTLGGKNNNKPIERWIKDMKWQKYINMSLTYEYLFNLTHFKINLS